MLTEDQIEILSEAIQPLFQYLEQEVIADIARRIQKTLTYSRTAELQATAMKNLGYSPARIRKEAMKLLNAEPEFRKAVAKNTMEYKREVRKIIQKIETEAVRAGNEIVASAGHMAWVDDLSVWKEAGKTLKKGSYLSVLSEAFSDQTAGALRNLTKTTGFQGMYGYADIENAYRRELDKAVVKVCSGTFSQDKVLRDTVHGLAQSGLRSIDYASGYSMQLDTAARLAVRTGCHQLSGRILDANITRSGVDLVYVSKHWGARNKGAGRANHEQWQGKIYSVGQDMDYAEEAVRIGQNAIDDLWEITGYSIDGTRENDPLGLYGYNCRHRHHPWFAGISEFPKDQPEPEPATIHGKTYDYYAMSQKMRSMERAVRALKREKEALKALGVDTKEISARISRKTEEYKEFCRDCGVPEKTTRLRYECGTSDLKKTQAWKHFEVSAGPADRKIVENAKYDTMRETKEEKVVDVHTVGTINRDIYRCISEDIVTDEVVITDNQMQHIIERHPEVYDNVIEHINQVIQAPDYIINDHKHINTGLVIKRIVGDKEHMLLVLKICTSQEPRGYKNSIITSWEISEKRLQNYLRNKEILYKRE